MKKSLRARNIVVLLVVLCLAMLISTLTINDNVSHSTAYAASDSVSSNFTITLTSDGTGYKVAARNRQMTTAIIPEKYNGLAVKEIADNGFTSCVKLKEVKIPHTVIKIGNNAFANCSNLEKSVYGMPRVERIGNNAFAMCPKLNDLVLPNTINFLGSRVLRNNSNTVYSRMTESAMDDLNDQWLNDSKVQVVYGNSVLLSEIFDDQGEEIIGYSIKKTQNINNPNVDFVLGDTYKDKPLLEIKKEAFYGCEFKSFTLKHGIIDPEEKDVTEIEGNETQEDSIKGFLPLDTECDHEVNIKSSAFSVMQAEYIDILVNVRFDDDEVNEPDYEDYENGHSTDIFAYSLARSITLPNNITYIPHSMFSGCFNLREIKNVDRFVDVNRISGNITTIGADAFAYCPAMLNLYIPSSVTTVGNAIFNGWGDSEVEQKVHFEDFYEAPVGMDGYDWNPNWQGTTYDNFKVQFKTISVVFDKEGGKEGVGTNGVSAMYNQNMPVATAPEREHYDFGGYFSKRNGGGTQYYDENMASVNNWDKKDATILYAHWIPHTFSVMFDKDGGTGGSDEVIASYEQPMPSAIKPTKTGFEFLGYYLDGNQYYDENMNGVRPWNFAENGRTLTAKWRQKDYAVKLNEQENTTHIIFAKYDEPMPLQSKPIRAGFEFMGYFTEPDGKGIKYYDENMESARNWDIDSEDPVDLYAYWIQKEFTISFYYNDGSDRVERITGIHYGDPLPDADFVPFVKGKAFKGYRAENKELYYTNDMSPAKIAYDVDGNLDLYAELDFITYRIYYELDGGTNNPDNPEEEFTIEYDHTLLEPTNPPLVFLYWSYNNVEIGNNLNELIESLDEGVTSITLKANWTDTEIINVNEPFGTKDVSLPKVKIYMLAEFSNECTINVASTTEILEIYGDGRTYNMNIEVVGTANLSMHLHNILLQAHSNSSAIVANSYSTVNLHTYDKVRIQGTTNSIKNGTAAIICGNLNILTASNLFIIGGDGKDGANGFYGNSGGNGGNAGAGVIGNVNIQCHMYIYAGLAGNGGDSIELPTMPGAQGYGGKGGKGAKAVTGELIIGRGVNCTVVDSENGEDGTGRTNIIPGNPGVNPDPVPVPDPTPVPNPDPVIPPVTPPIIIK